MTGKRQSKVMLAGLAAQHLTSAKRKPSWKRRAQKSSDIWKVVMSPNPGSN